ncbi:unnamed protein product [Strongylus vulgaris]|uniref:Reverse transcriptase domain-containing protein n=1 Tax=Strongylus vulgaris TaxID=40348 RepID=A0A3P7JHM4_STRVU|nr:unnamed protein product [Strongylus vulgaris]
MGDEITIGTRDIQADGRLLSNRFADDIVLLSRKITEAETMLRELNEVGKRVELRINRKKTQFIKNTFGEDQEMELEGSLEQMSSYAYLIWRTMKN